MEFPNGKWVRVSVRNSTILGFAYVDRDAGPSIKGRAVRDPITPDQVTRVLNEPNATVRPAGFAIPMVVLTDEETRALGLPSPPDWYVRFYTPERD